MLKSKIIIPLSIVLCLSVWAAFSSDAFGLFNPAGSADVVEECTFPPKQASAVVVAPELEEPEEPGVIIELARNDTFTSILSKRGVPRKERLALSSAVSEYQDLRRLKPGYRMEILLSDKSEDGLCRVKRLRLISDRDELVEFRREEQGSFSAESLPLKHTTRVKQVSAPIDSSFFLTARKQGISRKIFTEFYNMLSARVDFQRGIRKGDTFSVVYEENDDRPLGTVHAGRLLYASLTLMGQSIGYYRFTTLDGFSGFFDENGQSIDTQLLKTPLRDGSLSSLFGSRKHPVLGYRRMHRGVDFSAKYGTPILAAGDGIIERVGTYGSYGKFIKIRHDAELETGYAHMSRYAKGMRPGVRVSQGDVIGYVGTSGLTSGPNLHYEVSRRGKRINPMTLKLPPVRTLTGEDLLRFQDFLREFQTGTIIQPV